jgi:hypothetical protein
VLLLLDCCFAASAAPIAGRAITETIAACGWEAIAPAPGQWSFTSALIEVLDEWIDHSFSVAMLHSKVLSVLKHEQPERQSQKKRKVECRRTPVYIHTSAEPSTPSINLSRLRSKESPEDKTKVGVQAASDGQVSSEAENPQNKPDAYSLDGLTSSEPTGNLKVPHVLISLALCEDQELELKACSEWLAAFPALAKYAKVKGVYRSHSTLIIASVPVVIWDLLPENRACSFIGYVTSDNLLDLRQTRNGPTIAAYSQAVDADDDSKAEHHPDLMTLRSKPDSGVPFSEPTFSSSVFQPSSSSSWLSEPLHAGPGGSVSSSTTISKSATDSATNSSLSNQGSKRSRNNDYEPSSDGEDDPTGQPRLNLHKPQNSDASLKLACPFRKHDPRKYNLGSYRICAITPWENIARLK